MQKASTRFLNKRVSGYAFGALLVGAIVVNSALAAAQDAAKPVQPESPGFFGTIGRWFNQTTDSIDAGVSGVRKRFESFGNQAGVAARSTVDTAKDAADAVARIPNTRVLHGHEKCQVAPNGAPDCVAAANTMCKAKGFGSGSSLDMTTAEVCPAQVYLSGRTGGTECRTETFVSRVFCQ